MKHAFLRLFLVFFPLLPLYLALVLSENSQKPSEKKEAALETQCPPFIGVSPLFKEQNLSKKRGASLSHYPFISETDFFKQISKMQSHFKQNNISLDYLFITLPLYLTKDNHWIVSNRSFIISQNLERKEVSHIDHKNLWQSFFDTYKSNPLTLNKILKKYPKTSLLLKMEGLDDKKILKQLDFLTNHGGLIYLLSSNEDLLKEISHKYPKILFLHSFKKLIRFKLLNILRIQSFVNFPGDGVLAPSSLSPSHKTISYIKNLNKLFLLEEENLNKIPKILSKSINGLVSSNFQSSKEFIEHKNSCFLK